ncbi:CHC2 zinc finger domain-containing protein [Blautia obeum]|uniref:CHC2 zinc finger domain-containing protein n=1 Tax=Blautia obeum TaxID=40520 RepID=UPI002ECFC280
MINTVKNKWKERQRTKQDFEEIKAQISVEAVADYLMQKQGKNYIYPGERTASIKIYPESNSFYDFGRATGGDCVRLWSHIKGCDSWTALNEVRKTFGLNTPDKQHSRELIAQQQEARKRRQEAKKQKQERWIRQVDELKTEVDLLSAIISSGHCEPLSWLWCVCQNRLTTVEGKLDLLCGI